MSLETTGIDHINLQVNNLAVAISFWKKLLGFDVLEEIPEQKGVIIGTREAKLALYENPRLGRVEKHGFSHVCFHIRNFEKAVSLCNQNKIPVLYEGVVQWPHSRSLYIEDPNGYEVELTDKWGGALD